MILSRNLTQIDLPILVFRLQERQRSVDHIAMYPRVIVVVVHRGHIVSEQSGGNDYARLIGSSMDLGQYGLG